MKYDRRANGFEQPFTVKEPKKKPAAKKKPKGKPAKKK